MQDFIAALRSLLDDKLPGTIAQYRMAPGARLENVPTRYQDAAVLILLFPKDGKIWTVLMKRPEYPGVHSNQISLPGGKSEHGDVDLQATALREAGEELGINEKKIRILGMLSRLEIPVSGIKVLPFVGHHPGLPLFRPNPHEVRYLIEVPLSDFLQPETRQEEIRTILCKQVRIPYYNIQRNQVWGATAMIISEFIELLRKMEPGLLR